MLFECYELGDTELTLPDTYVMSSLLYVAINCVVWCCS